MKQSAQMRELGEENPSSGSRVGRFLRGSLIIRFLLRLTDAIYTLAANSLIGTYLSRYTEKSPKASEAIPSRISRRINLRGRFIRPLKFRIARSFENSLLLTFLRRVLRRLLALPSYQYGAFFLSFGAGALLIHGSAFLFGRGQILTLIGISVAVLAVIVAFPLFGSSRPVGEMITESRICDMILFRFIGARREGFLCEDPARCHPITAIILGIAAAAACVVLSPVYLIGGAAALIALYTVLAIPEFGVAVLFLAMPFLPTMLLVGLVLLVTFSYLIKVLCGKRTLRFETMDLWVTVLCVFYLFGGIFSSDISLSLEPMLVILCFLLSYFLVVNLIRGTDWIKRCIGCLACSTVLVSLYGIYQYFFSSLNSKWQDTEMFDSISGRVVSTLENPNVLGEFLIMAIPFFFCFFFLQKGFSKKTLTLVPLGIVGLCLIFTWSRGAWLGLILGALLFLLMYNRKSLTVMFFALFGIPALPYVLPENILLRFTSIGNLADSSTSYRVYIWKGTLRMIRDYFVSGIGTGVNVFPTIYPRYSYGGIETAPHSHNLFLEITVELGIFGLIAFLAIVICFAKQSFHANTLNGAPRERLFTIAGFSGIVAVLAQGMTDYVWYNYRVLLWFWLITGLTCAAARAARRQDAVRPETF